MTQPVLTPAPERETPRTGVTNQRGVAETLSAVLGDSYVLMVKTQGYHWNVVGPLFQPIHELTEKHYRDLFEAIDTMAERIRALGEVAPMSFADMQARALLTEEVRERKAGEMVDALIADHETMAQKFRDLAALAADNRDGATEDMANDRMAFHEEANWMLRAIVAE